MLGSSRSSFAAAREELSRRAGSDGFAGLSGELLAASSAIAGSSALRSALADSGTEPAARQELARSVFDGRVSGPAVEVITDVAGRRWRSGRDLVDAVESLGIEVAFIAAEQAGTLDGVEDELFRVDRLVAGDETLRKTLTDPAVADDTKAALLADLLDDRVNSETIRLVGHVVAHPRGRRLGDALEDLVEQSARRRERLVANVRVAAPMGAEQEQRLAAALGRVYRHDVDLQIEVDPTVRGGVVVRIGDEVIDGSVAHRIEQVRRRLGAANGA